MTKWNWVLMVIGLLVMFVGAMALKTAFFGGMLTFCFGGALASWNFCMDSDRGVK